MSTQINPSVTYNNSIFGRSITVSGLTNSKASDIHDEKTTINLTSIGSDDLKTIDTFLKSSNPEKWKIKIDDKYIDLSKDSKEWLTKLKGEIGKNSITKAELKTVDGKPAIEFFLRNTTEDVGIHDKNGYSLNPFSDYEDPLILGKKLNTFDSPEKAEEFCKKRSGAEIIVRNKEGQYDIFEIKGDPDELLSSADFENNYSSFSRNINNMMGGTHSFISTSDNKLMALSGHTAVEIPKINYNLAKVDLNLKLEDINGIETDGLKDLNGTIKGSISIDIQHKLEEILNGLGLPKNTRINIEYDASEKAFKASINYQKGVIDVTPNVLTIRPMENGALNIDALGLVGVNLNLNNGIALGVDAFGVVNFQAVDINTTKENSPNVSIFGKNFSGTRNESGTHSFTPSATNYNLFPNVPSTFVLPIPTIGIPAVKTAIVHVDAIDDFEKSAHKTIADTIVNLAKSLNDAGFKIPDKLLKVNSSDLSKDDKQLINDFVNGKIPLEIDLERYIQVKGFEKISVNQLDPNIKFVNTPDNQLGVTFDTKIVASTNGNVKELATQDKAGSDKLSITIDADINNVSSSLNTKLEAEAHVDKTKKADFEKKFGVRASGDINLSAEIDVDAPTNDFNKLDISADVSVSIKNASIEIPNSNIVANLSVKPSKISTDVNVSQENNKININANVETTLYGSIKSKDNKQTMAKFDYLSVKGNVVCESEKGLAKLSANGAVGVTGSFDSFSVSNFNSYGSFRYKEKDGILISASAGVSIKGYGGKPAEVKSNDGKDIVQINNINGSGSVRFDKNGNITNSNIKGTIDIKGSTQDNPYALKASGDIKINRLPNGAMQFDVKMASIDKLQFNDVTLEGLKNISGRITYNPLTKEISIESLTNEPQNITGKINGKDIVIKEATSKLVINGTFTNKDNATLSIIPEGTIKSFKYDDYELKDFSVKGGRLLVGASKSSQNSVQSLTLESVDQKTPFEIKGKLIDDKKNAVDLEIVSTGSINIDAIKIKDQPRKYSIRSNVNISKLKFGDLNFENVKIDGRLETQNGKISINGNSQEQKLIFDATLIQNGKKEKIYFDTNGKVDIDKTQNSLEVSCDQKVNIIYEDVELKDADIKGKIKYTDIDGNKTVNFTNNGEETLKITGKLTFNSSEKISEGNYKKMVANFENIQLDGSATIEKDGKISFNNLKANVTGNLNGIDLDLITEVNGSEKGNYDIKISGNVQNAIELNSGLTVKRLSQDEIQITGDLNTKTEGDVAFKKMTNYLDKLPLGKEYHNQLGQINKMTYNLKDADMAMDMNNLSIKFNEKTKVVEFDCDIKGGVKGLTAVYNAQGDYNINSGLAKNVLEKYKDLSESTKGMLNTIITSKKNTTLSNEKFTAMLKTAGIPEKDIAIIKSEMKVPEYNADGGVSGHLNINSSTGTAKITNGEIYAGLDKFNKILSNFMKEDLSKTGTITEFREKDNKKILDIYTSSDMKQKFPIELDPNKTGVSEDGSLNVKVSTSVFFDLINVDIKGETVLGVENGLLKLSLDKLNILGFIGVKDFGTEKANEQLEQMFDGSDKSQKALYEAIKNKEVSKFKENYAKTGKPTEGREYERELKKGLEKLHLNSLEKYTEFYGVIRVDMKKNAIYMDIASLMSDPGQTDKYGKQKSSTVIKLEDTKNIFLDGRKSELAQKDKTVSENQEKFSFKFNMEVTDPNTQVVVNDVVDFIDDIKVKNVVEGVVDVLDTENTLIQGLGDTYENIIKNNVNPALEEIDKTKANIEQIDKTVKTEVKKTSNQVNNVVNDVNKVVNQADNIINSKK